MLSAAQAFTALNQVRPDHAVLVEESPSNLPDLHTAWPVTEPDTFYTFASGGLGWDLPAAVGIALAERDSGRNRPVIAVIGDGSFQYSVQSIWTAARLRLPMLIVVVQNSEYAILKSFAKLEQAPGVPGLDIPGLDIVSIARGRRPGRRSRYVQAGGREGMDQAGPDGAGDPHLRPHPPASLTGRHHGQIRLRAGFGLTTWHFQVPATPRS